MSDKVIKISEKNYTWLVKETASLSYESGKKATFNDVVDKLRSSAQTKKKQKLLSLAGMWADVSDTDISLIQKQSREAFTSWTKK